MPVPRRRAPESAPLAGSLVLDFRKDPRVLSAIVDAMADGVFTVDARGRFVAWSAGAERITGWSSSQVIGQPCSLLEGPGCKGFGSLVELLREPAPAPTGICCQECKVLSKDGRELYLHGNVRLLTAPDGRVQGAVGTFSDLTEFLRVNERAAVLEERVRGPARFHRLVGRSGSMQELSRRLQLAANSEVTVLLNGESGTGKELAARAIHDQSARAKGPFAAINCSALPESLLESELFGHVKGAFTGATRDRAGVFESARGGTLFLDEIADVSPLIQLKLLRVLQEREVRRVGDERALPVDVRLITATNRSPRTLLSSGAWREDFYYRIRVFEILLPPLREHREDIPLLVEHFLAELSPGRRPPGIARDALRRLMDHPWPGNVRELRNAIEHAMVTVQGDLISLLDLPPEIRAHPAAGAGAPVPDASAEADRLRAALVQTGGNRSAAARRLGISRVTLWKRLRALGLMHVPRA